MQQSRTASRICRPQSFILTYLALAVLVFVAFAFLIFYFHPYLSYFELPQPVFQTSGPGQFMEQDRFQIGWRNLEGWANPGEAGKLEVKVVEKQTGKNFLSRFPKSKFGGRIGFSNNPNEKFHFKIPFTSWGDGDGMSRKYRVELWFYPANGSSMHLIYQSS